MLSSLWRTLIHRQFGHSSQGNRWGKSSGKRRPRLHVEPREDRCLLAAHIDSFTVDASSVSEGAPVTAFGSFTVDPEDAGLANNYFVRWGDGSTQDGGASFGPGTFPIGPFTHRYLDDTGPGTTTDFTVLAAVFCCSTSVGGPNDVSSRTVTVNNVAPTLGSVSATPIDENGTTTLSGSISDPGTLDTFRLRINWHDGTTLKTVDLPAGSTSFSVTHQYLDDNPTGTPSDQFTIDLTLSDDDTGEATATTTVTVNNVDPKLTALAATSVDENGVSHLTGTIVDPGTLDTFTLLVYWGDGTANEIVELGTAHTFDLTHKYLDDNPTGTPADTNTIFVRLADDDFGIDEANVDVTVHNMAPLLRNVRMQTPDGVRNLFDEGSEGMLVGNISDPGPLDTFTLVVDWGDGSPVETIAYEAGVTEFGLTHTFADDNPSSTPADVYTVHVTLTDDDTGSDSASFQVQVNNVAPTIISLTTTVPDPNPNPPGGPVDEGTPFTLDITVSDPAKPDTFRLRVNWGDGSLPEIMDLVAGTSELHVPHTYLDDNPTETPFDRYDINATLIDDDGGITSKTVPIEVFNVDPLLNHVQATPVDENSVAVLSGTIVDPGILDTFTLEVDWGDGSPRENFTYGAGTRTFLEHHKYPDDNPIGTPQDTYTIGLVLNDDDGIPDMALVDCLVRNVAPKLEHVQVTSRSRHYSVFADVDGNGRIKPADENAVARRVRRLRPGKRLPGG